MVKVEIGDTMLDQRTFVLGQLDRTQSMFARVEGKASFLFALNVAMLALMAVNLDLRHPFGWHGVCVALAGLLLASSLWNLYSAYAPSLDGAKRPSLLYFRDIADRTESSYCAALKDAPEADLVDDAMSQVWRNSQILAKKFSRVQRAFSLTMVSVVPWVLFLAAVALDEGTFKLVG